MSLQQRNKSGRYSLVISGCNGPRHLVQVVAEPMDDVVVGRGQRRSGDEVGCVVDAAVADVLSTLWVGKDGAAANQDILSITLVGDDPVGGAIRLDPVDECGEGIEAAVHSPVASEEAAAEQRGNHEQTSEAASLTQASTLFRQALIVVEHFRRWDRLIGPGVPQMTLPPARSNAFRSRLMALPFTPSGISRLNSAAVKRDWATEEAG